MRGRLHIHSLLPSLLQRWNQKVMTIVRGWYTSWRHTAVLMSGHHLIQCRADNTDQSYISRYAIWKEVCLWLCTDERWNWISRMSCRTLYL